MTIYRDSSYSLQTLLAKIEHGEIALPDIQRPFVWSNTQVRDLFDSMYNGFPVGYLLFWQTAADTGIREIGVTQRQAHPTLLIVDGQQRLTSLYAVMNAAEIVKDDYTASRIRISFKPRDGRFEVTDAAIEQDPEFVPDISVLYEGKFYSRVTGFIEKLESHIGQTLDPTERETFEQNLDRVRDLMNYRFQVIELDSSIDEEKVSDIFVRINSKGVQLRVSDFILTLMSVFWEDGRKDLEAFSRKCKRRGDQDKPTPFNHFIEPSPDQLLRASVGLAFRRGRLRSIYSILRGKDLESETFDPSRRTAQFENLAQAQEHVLDLNNWHEFLKCLTVAGFRSSRMITSEVAVIYSYLFWLIGKIDFGVPSQELRAVISQWWFMAHTTSRYSGSTESVVESDLNQINNLDVKTSEEFCNLLLGIINDTFTKDYWAISLPNKLDSASAKSPALSAYWAALNILKADVLFSDMKIDQMLDPIVTPVRDLERHHLFPRAYLDDIGIKEQYRRNRISNMSFVDWKENAKISGQAPQIYWPTMTSGMSETVVQQQMYHHALPNGWENMPYEDFCDARRRLISDIIKEGFKNISDRNDNEQELTLKERIKHGESLFLEFKERARWSHGTNTKNKSELIIVKTLSGFMNSNGGVLLIGVKDDGQLLGLEEDYRTLSRPNRDGFELFLSQLVSNNISGPANAYCRYLFHEIEGKEVCEIKVAASPRPVFASSMDHGGQQHFWVRDGNRTVQYFGQEQQDYIQDHWV